MSSGLSHVHILDRQNETIKTWSSTKVCKTRYENPDTIRFLIVLTDTRNSNHGSDSHLTKLPNWNLLNSNANNFIEIKKEHLCWSKVEDLNREYEQFFFFMWTRREVFTKPSEEEIWLQVNFHESDLNFYLLSKCWSTIVQKLYTQKCKIVCQFMA